jgi:hypothetical protein
MQNSEFHNKNWDEVSEYISAANIAALKLADNLCDIEIEILYGNSSQNITTEADFKILCINYKYFDVKRLNHLEADEPNSSIIYEAKLLKESELINKLFKLELDGIAGNITSLNKESKISHLRIIGEISIDVLCEEVITSATEFRQNF